MISPNGLLLFQQKEGRHGLFISLSNRAVPGLLPPGNRRYAAMPARRAPRLREGPRHLPCGGHRGSAGPGALRRRQHRERGRLGQPEHSGPCGPRAGFCRNLCLSAGRTADGGRRGGPAHRGAVFEYGAPAAHLSLRLRPPCGAHPQPAGRDIAEEPRALPPHFPHLAQNHPRAAAVLPFRPGAAGKQPQLRHSLRPPAAGGLPWRGPQRAFRRAGPDARGRPHPFPQKRI